MGPDPRATEGSVGPQHGHPSGPHGGRGKPFNTPSLSLVPWGSPLPSRGVCARVILLAQRGRQGWGRSSLGTLVQGFPTKPSRMGLPWSLLPQDQACRAPP